MAPKATDGTPKKKVPLLDKMLVAVTDYLERKVDERHLRKTAEEVREASQEASQEYKTVAVSSLPMKEVVKVLDLKHNWWDHELQDVQPVPLPPLLVGTLSLIKSASTRSPTTEASTQWIIDTLILNAYDIAGSDIPYAQPVNVQTERSFKYGPVKLHGQKVNLSARPDYGIWYGEHEAVCLNVLIVEAKKVDIGSGAAQALGYMGCIHRERKRFPKRESTVYGMATDGTMFWFFKISDDSKWSQHVVPAPENHYESVFGLLVYLFRRAALASPTHSKESSAQSYEREETEETSGALAAIYEDVEMKT
ncbi:hypothetical protein N7491_009182 [Penicillium cf. griseofulvum]|uniref:Uncharacterized protein n=1 Tax=Penicillium cf. griseofulvum TaxID=2972120 RepID=A0A9W9MFG9_9EURO|nr:hypothetical protein N7472_005223 [Penicillium cf. griseofulvum]KAJ5423966.1 hypothetical protein N7491_009182 [Penicillium cf. griseofulvum]